MKSLFPSYYPLDEQELDELWDNATFVFDTNILINLFRLNESSSNDILDTLEKIKDKMFIPHQIALEFHRNYPKAIDSHYKIFQDLTDEIDSSLSKLKKSIIDKNLDTRHAEINPNELTDEIEKHKEKLIKKVTDTKENSKHTENSKKTLDRLNILLDGKIGNEFTKEQFEKESKEADNRIRNQTPPGYKDKSKEKERDALPNFFFNNKKYSRSHGDYFYWKQTLDYCKENNISHLIIVTNDNKEDWWQMKNSNQKIAPRRELREEARLFGVTLFNLYSEQRFLEEVKTRSIQEIEQNTIDEVNSFSINEKISFNFTNPYSYKILQDYIQGVKNKNIHDEIIHELISDQDIDGSIDTILSSKKLQLDMINQTLSMIFKNNHKDNDHEKHRLDLERNMSYITELTRKKSNLESEIDQFEQFIESQISFYDD